MVVGREALAWADVSLKGCSSTSKKSEAVLRTRLRDHPSSARKRQAFCEWDDDEMRTLVLIPLLRERVKRTPADGSDELRWKIMSMLQSSKF